jgi:hypothetical protein
MKINRPGSSVGWLLRHSARASATSGRSCSAARSDFFERQAKQLHVCQISPTLAADCAALTATTWPDASPFTP